MKTLLKILPGYITLMMLAAGCSFINEKQGPACSKEQPVTILATIQDVETRAQSSLRAEGVVSDPDPFSWSPENVIAEAAERTIDHVFLFVYRQGDNTPHKVYFYHTSLDSELPSDAEVISRRLELDPSAGDRMGMNLELFPGAYNFVLIANSHKLLAEVKRDKKMDRPEQLVEESVVFTSDDLRGSNRKYLPMVGQHELYVPNTGGTSDADRNVLTPSIKLERIHARIDFRLTTANADGSYLSPLLSESSVVGLTLEREQSRYTVLPSEADYTVTGTGTTAPIRATALQQSYLKEGRPSFHQGTDNDSGKIDAFQDRRLPYDKANSQSKYIYVAPSTLAKQESEALTLLFKVRFLNDTEDTTYRIPIYNAGNGVTEANKYVVRRNTIYRLDAKLKGRDLTVLDYKVIDWNNQYVDIPW